MSDKPPFEITLEILDLSVRISTLIGRIENYEVLDPHPRLRKQNRIRSIYSSCTIEANSLSFDQVSDIFNGRRVIGPFDDIRDVRNAIDAYDMLGRFDPYSMDDFLRMHGIMTKGSISESGSFRKGGEGVFKGDKLIFMAPPPELVPQHMRNLFDWMAETKDRMNSLIVSCVFHYEMVFIHPFSDGNGRMARLWQTAILSEWNPIFQWIPIENRIERAQQEYYEVISYCDSAGESTRFIEFMLRMILIALEDSESEIRDAEKAVPENIKNLIERMEIGRYYTVTELMELMGLRSRPSFLRDYIGPARDKGLIEMEYPNTPRTTKQRYRLTDR